MNSLQKNTKGYKHTPIGWIPEDWETVNLEELVYRNRSIRYGIVQPGKYTEDGIFLIRGGDYSFGWVHESKIFRVSRELESKYRNARVNKGDLLITIVGAGTGNIAIVPEWLHNANITQTTARISLDPEKTATKYCFYSLSSRVGNKQVYTYLKGAAQPGLNCEDVAKFIIPLPPLPEQKKIAEILSAWDKAIKQTKNLIEAKKKIKKGLMQKLLTGQMRFPEFGKPAKKGDLPKGWEHTLLSNCGDIESGGTPDTNNPEYWNEHIPWLTPGEISKLTGRYVYSTDRYISESGLRNSSAKLLPINSLIISTRATIGEVVINKTPLAVNQGFKVLIPAKSFNLDFLFYRLISKKNEFIKFATGSTFNEISKYELSKIELEIPHYNEQEKIGSLLISVDSKIELLGKKLSSLQIQKKGLLQKLLTGQIRVRVDSTESKGRKK